ncbi:MAG: flagellar basal body rod protein FlgB [Lachnospiraceae bacterium]|nr:flagellar basal body rod protein FlgB [Lachnospiraceae bacterium]
MLKSSTFDYINVLDKGLDAAWIRNEAIANNIANATTPNYKRQDVDFESELKKALKYNRYTSMDEKVSNLKINRLEPRVYTDYAGYSYRLDGNNVDIDTENVALASNQLKYNGLMQSVTENFTNLKMVMK